MIAGKSVTITLGAYQEPKLNFDKGQIVNLGWAKRLKGIIMDVDTSVPYTHTLTLRNGYLAAPKSKLRRKTVFSKIKPRILNPKK